MFIIYNIIHFLKQYLFLFSIYYNNNNNLKIFWINKVKDVIDSKIIGLTKKDIQYKNDFKTIYQSATSNLI